MALFIFLLGIVPTQFAGIASAMKNASSESRLETLLGDWDRAVQNVRSAHYVMEWTADDRVFKDKEVTQVEGWVNGHNLARVDLKDEKGKPTQIFLLNNRVFEMYNFEREDKTSWDLPDGFPEVSQVKGWWQAMLARPFQQGRELFCFEF